MRTIWNTLFFCCLLPCCLCNAQVAEKAKPAADVLVFTNGDTLTGKLKSAANDKVVFHSDMAGDLTIPFAKVKTLTSGTEFVALHAEKPGKIKAVATGKVQFAENKVIVTPEKGEPQTFTPKNLSYLIDVPLYAKEVDHHAGFTQGWNGSATAGLTLVRATQQSTTFTGAVNLVRTIPTVEFLPNRNRTTVNVTESYGTSTSPVIPQTKPPSAPVVVQTSIFHGDAERDEYFTPRAFALGDVSFEHNFAQGLQLQQLYGVGVGWTVIQNTVQQLDVRADAHYEKQQFLASGLGGVESNGAMQDNLNLFGSTFQENYRRTLPRKLVLTEWANILPAWNDQKAYTANAYLGLTMPILKRLGVTLSATDNYLNDPSPGYRTNSVQFVTGLTYTMK